MSNKISFTKSFGKEDFKKIMDKIILRKISYYSFQDSHNNLEDNNKYTNVIRYKLRGE
jgi:hypothetical protein